MFCYTDPRASLGNIQTPPVVAQWIYDLLRKHKYKRILDPCAGEGNLLAPWACQDVIGIENDPQRFHILENRVWRPTALFQLSNFENLFSTWVDVDLVLCNPPWNRHWRKGVSYPEVFLRKIVELFGPRIPIVFLCPMGFRLNQKARSKRWQWLMTPEAPQISSIVSCPLDMYKDTKFHNEILFFNVPRLKPHYWMTEVSDGVCKESFARPARKGKL